MSNQENKKNYEAPTVSVMSLNVSDIITSSVEGGEHDEF